MLNPFQVEIVAIAAVVAAACALVGTFLLLRWMSLMSDAISHSILLGIVLMFFVVESTASWPMIVAATLTGVLTVAIVEAVVRTRLVKEDAAIGLVFPALFSLGVILISRFAGNIHLDVDAVLLGELAFAPFNRLESGGLDLGPVALWLAGLVLVLDLFFVLILYKELKLATFDAGLAAALGFSPVVVHYLLMTLVSVTAVASFEAVGSVLVVALMVAPPAAARLLTDRLPRMLGLGVLIGIVAAVSGYFVARALDASIAGSIATMCGVLFALALLFAPRNGLLANAFQRRERRVRFAGDMLLVHLLQHEGLAEEAMENSVEHLERHMHWTGRWAAQVTGYVARRRLAELTAQGRLMLTSEGRSHAQAVMSR